MHLVLIAILLTCAAPLLVSALARVRPQPHPGCAAPLHLPAYAYLVLAVFAAVGIVPQAFKTLGWVALPAITAGWCAPLLLQWTVRQRKAARPRFVAVGAPAEGDAGLALVALGLGGIVLHSFLDGAVLFSFGAPAASPILAPLVLLDRVTLGFVAWALLLPRFGRGVAASGLGLIAAMTVAGYAAFGFVSGRLAGDPLVAWINAALSGVVLYLMVSHAFVHHAPRRAGRRLLPGQLRPVRK